VIARDLVIEKPNPIAPEGNRQAQRKNRESEKNGNPRDEVKYKVLSHHPRPLVSAKGNHYGDPA
jgi:hypothetical protein